MTESNPAARQSLDPGAQELERLRATENIWQGMLESSPDAIMLIRRDGTIETANSVAIGLSGTLGQVITGLTFYDVVPHTVQKCWQERIEFALSNGKAATWEDTYDDRYFVNTAFPVKGGERVVVISRNVTQLRKAEESSQNKRARLKTLIETLPDLIWLKDTAGRYVNCNHKFERLLGTDEAAIKGKTDLDLLPHQLGEAFGRDGKAAIADGSPVKTQHWITYADGHKEFVEVINSPFIDGHGILKGVMGIARDVTVFKKVEEDLRYLNSLYKAQLDLSLDGVLVVDVSGRVVTFNRQFVEIWGLPESVLSETSSDSFLEAVLGKIEAPEQFVERIRYLLSHLEEKGFDEIRLKNGRVLERYTSMIVDSDNGYHGRIWYFRDISERILAEEKQRKLTEQLYQSQKMDALGQLAGGVAHDLNNALGAIMGTAELLIDEVTEEDRIESANLILKASERAGNLTRQLLAFARKSQQTDGVVDVRKLINDTAAILRRAINKNIDISVEGRAAATSVVGDDSLLQNCLLNLGINASHAMPRGGALVFSLENVALDRDYCETIPFDIEPGQYLKISVRDSGCGIAPENLARIFEPFFTTKEPGQGTGLGLATVYGTIQKHHGAVTVYSEIGEGTVFHVYLPVTGQTEVATLERDVVRGTGTVLIIDDEELVRITASSILTRLGYRTIEAVNGAQGVEIVKQRGHEIDLVVIDMIMPVMGGREAIAEIAKVNEELPIIVSSGFSRDVNAIQPQQSGGIACLNKPFRRADLAQVVADAIRNRKSPRV